MAQLRVALVKSRILSNEITAAGIGLRGGLLSPEAAIAHVCEAGGEHFLIWGSSS